ncbi:hypothetical protein Tco_1502606 [Tanacetum coccineum]
MHNLLKNDIVWESRRNFLTLPFPQKPTRVVQSCQRDPKASALSLVNQDLLYLKKGNSRYEKFVLSLHKFPTVIFPDDDIKGRTSRWVDKCVKKSTQIQRLFKLSKPMNLNKNDTEDMYLLCVNDEVADYVETGLLWSLVLEGLKSYNNDVKHGYVTPNLSKEDAEYL